MAPRPSRASRAMRAIDPARQERETRLGWRMMGVGLQTASEVAAGVLLGWFVDQYTGRAPWGLVIGGCVGIAVALFTLLRAAWRMNTEMDRAEAKAKTRQAHADNPPPAPGARER